VARVLQELPPDFPIPIAVVVHMPPGYTAGFARRLDGECAIEVREAEEGLAFRPGRAVIALAGRHLKVVLRAGSPLARIDALPAGTTHRPSVDVLFESAAGAMPRGSVLGVILTGMGDDGLAGARAIRAAGGKVIVEAEESCAVYGMPRAVAEAGLAAAQVPIERMAEAIIENL
jgi:two-component system chemotaxis response regulator CheB